MTGLKLDDVAADMRSEANRLLLAADDIDEMRADLSELDELSAEFTVRINDTAYDPRENGPYTLYVEAETGVGQFVTETLPAKYQWRDYSMHFGRDPGSVVLRAKLDLESPVKTRNGDEVNDQ